MIEPLDYERLAAEELTRRGVPAQPTPYPEDLGADLPAVVCVQTGGQRLNIVVDAADVSFDVYAATFAEAVEQARKAFGAVMAFADGKSALQWRRVEANSLPYANPDPQHPSIPRASFFATLYARAN